MSRTAFAPAESYSTFWDEAPIEVTEEFENFSQADPYAAFSAATEDDSKADPVEAS